MKNEQTSLYKRVKVNFHKYVQLRDVQKAASGELVAKCIACSKSWILNTSTDWKNFVASHYWRADLYKSIELNPMNVNGSCAHCNTRKHGNISEYQIHLLEKIGQENFDKLIIKRNQVKKCSFSELEELNNFYLEKIKEQKQRLGIK